MPKLVAIVTGGTSGIGLATALALRDAGCSVYTVSRREEGIGGIFHLRADVTDEQRMREVFDEIFARENRLDILVNCAGFGISGATEFTENADAKRLMDVNLFGAVNAIKCAIPHMRETGGGRIVSVSSVAAALSIPYQAWYSVSKAALNAYICALSNEVKQFRISVCAVMPGDIKTGFTSAREKNTLGNDVYAGRICRSVAKMEKDEQNGMDPACAGRFIAKIATKKRVKPLYAVGLTYKFFIMLSRLLPVKLIDFLLGVLYSGK